MERGLRQKGVQGLVRSIARRLRVSSDKLFYMRALTKPVDGFRPLPHIDVRRFAAPTAEFSAIYRTFTDATAFTDRFAGRVCCDVAFLGDEPVAFLGTSLGDCEVPALNATLRLAPKDASFMEVYTKPAHRRKGIAEFLRNCVCQELSALGYKRLFGLTDVRNQPMLQLATKTGYVPYYRIAIRRLAPVERLIATPCRREDEGGLRIERTARGLLPIRRPRWTVTVMEPEVAGSSLIR
jgi:GNAT superfamily N-acetyltransferase